MLLIILKLYVSVVSRSIQCVIIGMNDMVIPRSLFYFGYFNKLKKKTSASSTVLKNENHIRVLLI